MKINKKLYAAILFATILFIIYSEYTDGGTCAYFTVYFESSIKGMVINKFNDSTNHNTATVLLLENSVENQILVRGSDMDVFQFITVGDSVYKNSKSKELKIIRQGILYKMILTYGCDSVSQNVY